MRRVTNAIADAFDLFGRVIERTPDWTLHYTRAMVSRERRRIAALEEPIASMDSALHRIAFKEES